MLNKEQPQVEVRDAIEWTAQLAEAGAANLRNGPSRVRRARNAMMQLVDEGAAPADAETNESDGCSRSPSRSPSGTAHVRSRSFVTRRWR